MTTSPTLAPASPAPAAGRPAGTTARRAERSISGILDIQGGHAFVRASSYLPGPNDVFVPPAQMDRHGLRRGDLVSGAAAKPQNPGRQKRDTLVRLETRNGERPRERAEFGTLTPLYPQHRLRLENGELTTRITDLISPIGKGQRGLIVAPPKAGKTLLLKAIASAVAEHNPECHLMVALIDERPEEVTDLRESVHGEVIHSTFDREPADHITVAELAVERAKRLVETGRDVVVLLDSITRLGRAYNLAAPASDRILTGGVAASALHGPKKLLGAARNLREGGSLTILATALVETGSKLDDIFFEEFKGTGNMELKLSRQLADKRIFPAVDIAASGTRKEEILIAPDELQILAKLRRVLHALETGPAMELLTERMKATTSNAEFLRQVRDSAP